MRACPNFQRGERMEAVSGRGDQASLGAAALSRVLREQPPAKRAPLASARGEGRGQAGRVG